MIYPTLKATVRQGKIQLLDEVNLPENTVVLVTVMDDAAIDALSLGERMIASLQDILVGHVTEISSPRDLTKHLDSLFSKE